MNYECTVKYKQKQDNGMIRAVTERYLVRNAISIGEAAGKVEAELIPYIATDGLEVTIAKQVNYSDIIQTSSVSADKWYKVKISLITLDEKGGKEKKQTSCLLVQAGDIEDARKLFVSTTKDWAVDYVIESVSETKILDVYEC